MARLLMGLVEARISETARGPRLWRGSVIDAGNGERLSAAGSLYGAAIELGTRLGRDWGPGLAVLVERRCWLTLPCGPDETTEILAWAPVLVFRLPGAARQDRHASTRPGVTCEACGAHGAGPCLSTWDDTCSSTARLRRRRHES